MKKRFVVMGKPDGAAQAGPTVQIERVITMGKVLLTAGTDKTGRRVAERLRAAGHQLTGLARSDASAAKLQSAGIQPVR